MILKKGLVATTFGVVAILAAVSCAKGGGGASGDNPGGGGGGGGGDADGGKSTCTTCDSDNDGVSDADDDCPGTAQGAKVNEVGCADAQLTPKLEPTFPSYGLTWTPSGDLGRP
ncbi:MAG TPA: hypothetical protein VF407_13245, partial [Polyangiaceae bacterium]